jgi:hypothetical protein
MVEWGPYAAFLDELFGSEEEARRFASRLRKQWEFETWQMLKDDVLHAAVKSVLKYGDVYKRLAKK